MFLDRTKKYLLQNSIRVGRIIVERDGSLIYYLPQNYVEKKKKNLLTYQLDLDALIRVAED